MLHTSTATLENKNNSNIKIESIFDELRASYPDIMAIALVSAHALGNEGENSNIELIAFSPKKPQRGWGTHRQILSGSSLKIDMLPSGLLRNPAILPGSLSDERLLSTISNSTIIYDPTDAFASFKDVVKTYPPSLRKKIALARLAKFYRARKACLRAIQYDDNDLLITCMPHALENFAHIVLARSGIYAKTTWLMQLKQENIRFYDLLQHAYSQLRNPETSKQIIKELDEAICPYIGDITAEIQSIMKDESCFKALSQSYFYIDSRDLEILAEQSHTRISEYSASHLVS